jgi:arylsulfatase
MAASNVAPPGRCDPRGGRLFPGARAFGVWRQPFTELRVPLLFHLRRDPLENGQHNSNTYSDWFLERPFVIGPIQALAARFLQTMTECAPSQTPGSFNLGKTEKQPRADSGP